METGLLAEAATYFERALANDPDNPDLRRQLFLLSLASGRYDAALDQAGALVAEGADVPEAELLLSLEEVRAGSFGDAHRRLAAMTGKVSPV